MSYISSVQMEIQRLVDVSDHTYRQFQIYL